MKLRDVHFRAIDLLLSGQRQKQIAGIIGVSEETLSTWINNDHDFADALHKARRDFRQSHVNALAALTDDALSTLKGLLQSQDERVRIQAVSLVLKSVGLDDATPELPRHDDARIPTSTDEMMTRANEALSRQIAESMSALAGLV